MRRAFWIGIGVLICGAIVAGIFSGPWREPVYQGRTLSSWLQQETEPARHTNKLAEARLAIRSMDAHEVVPVLLRLVRSSDRHRTVRSLMLDVARQFNLFVGPVYQSDDPSDMAVAGFRALGTNAAFAVPDLAQIANHPKYALTAFQCLSCIGPPARPVVTAALTNNDARLRSFAISSLSGVVENDQEALNLVKPRLNDPDPDVRTTAIQLLGTRLRTEPESLPLLIEVLRRGNTNDAAITANEIGNFDSNAICAFETLSNTAYQSPHSQAALASLRSMLHIAPERTLPFLSHRLHSIDPWLRSQALMLLVREYPNTEDVIPSVEYAAQDPEEAIATRAERFLEGVKQRQPTAKPAR